MMVYSTDHQSSEFAEQIRDEIYIKKFLSDIKSSLDDLLFDLEDTFCDITDLKNTLLNMNIPSLWL